MLNEFKEFAIKGNVVDMGVGIVIGAAFTTIVKSFVADIVNPIIGVVTGGVDFSNLFINLGDGDFASLAAAQEAGAPTINYGLFINAIIAFGMTLVRLLDAIEKAHPTDRIPLRLIWFNNTIITFKK